MKRSFLLIVLLAGCGGGQSDPVAVADPVNELVALSLTPQDFTTDIGNQVVYTYQAFGSISITNAEVTWESTDPSVATINGGVATVLASGTTQIKITAVSNPAVFTSTSLTGAPPPPTPGRDVIYGHDDLRGIVRYEVDGTSTVVGTFGNASSIRGFEVIGQTIYFLQGQELYQLDPTTGAISVLTSLVTDNQPRGLSSDSQGMLYTSAGGDVWRIDPATPDSQVVVGSAGVAVETIAIGANDDIYCTSPPVASAWVLRMDATGFLSKFIDLAPGATRTTGLYAAANGDVYVTDQNGTVWRGVDANGDGDCNDNGEVTQVVSFGAALGIVVSDNGTVYVNVVSDGIIHRFEDGASVEWATPGVNHQDDQGCIKRDRSSTTP